MIREIISIVVAIAPAMTGPAMTGPAVASPEPPQLSCPGKGYYSDRDESRVYYWCEETGAVPSRSMCGYGTVFHENYEVCDYAQNVPRRRDRALPGS